MGVYLRCLLSGDSFTKILVFISLGKKWADGLGEHYTAVTDYDFNAGNDQELSFKAGQTLRLAPRALQPRIKGWMLAGTDAQHTGLVPANYIKILAKHENAMPV